MKTEKELNGDILEITMNIENKYPELSKYLEETPFEASGTTSKDENIKDLKEYYDSLDALLKKYSKSHEGNIH